VAADCSAAGLGAAFWAGACLIVSGRKSDSRVKDMNSLASPSYSSVPWAVFAIFELFPGSSEILKQELGFGPGARIPLPTFRLLR
jgi:hypothetical protein